MLVIAAALMGIAAVVHQSRLDQVAADAARRASLGQPHSSLGAYVHSALGPDVSVTVETDEPGHTVCVSLSGPAGLGLMPDDVLTLESVSCALLESP